MYNKEQIYNLIDQTLELAGDHPARVSITSQAEGLSRIANSEIHQNVYEDRTTLTISVFASHKESSISTNILTPEGLADAVKEAIANLNLLPESEEQPSLVNDPLEVETISFNQELHDSFSVVARAKMIAEGLATIPTHLKAFGQLSYKTSAWGIGSSTGIKRFSNNNQVDFNLVISDDKGGSGFANMSAFKPEEVNLSDVFAIALDKVLANQDPIELEPGAYTVILEPLAVSNLFSSLLFSGFSGRSLLHKMSFLTDRLGEQVFSEKLTAIDDWSNPLSPGVAFDAEGSLRQKLTLLDKGIPLDVAYDLATAKKAGVNGTGHTVSFYGRNGAIPINIVIANGEKPLSQIIAETDKALLVTRFHYMNPVNMRQAILTGITRDGFFLIENGKISKAVRNMRFTESMLKAFNQIEEISLDYKRIASFLGASCLPAMKINNFHFTGKTSFSDTKPE